MTTHVLRLYRWHPVRLNQVRGRHWAKEAKAKKAQALILYCEAKKQNVPQATGRRSVILHVYGWGDGGQLPDVDAFDKILLDSLKQAGLITNDDAKGVKGRVDVVVARSHEPRTVLYLTEEPDYAPADLPPPQLPSPPSSPGPHAPASAPRPGGAERPGRALAGDPQARRPRLGQAGL
jgi:hypothetical protein